MSLQLNESKVLIDIENFVARVSFHARQPKGFYNELTKLLMAFDEIYNSDFFYSASIGALIELLVDMDSYLDDSKLLLERLSEIPFNDLKYDFKKHYRRHKRQLQHHRYGETVNTEQLSSRMEQVAKRYARILVVRVDLAYPLKYQGAVGIPNWVSTGFITRHYCC